MNDISTATVYYQLATSVQQEEVVIDDWEHTTLKEGVLAVYGTKRDIFLPVHALRSAEVEYQ